MFYDFALIVSRTGQLTRGFFTPSLDDNVAREPDFMFLPLDDITVTPPGGSTILPFMMQQGLYVGSRS